MSPTKTRTLIGERVRQIRWEKGISQGDLADLAGINRSYLSMIENGKSSPTIEVAGRLAEGLEVATSDLVFSGREPEQRLKITDGQEIYNGLSELLKSEDLFYMGLTEDEIDWLKYARFREAPSKSFFKELIVAYRKSR